jgi:hypothetical protein
MLPLEARLAAAEARSAEGSTAVEKHFADFCVKPAGNLAPLREAYEGNI